MSDTLDIPGAEGLCRTFADAMEVGDMDGRYVAQSEARALVAYVNGLREKVAKLDAAETKQILAHSTAVARIAELEAKLADPNRLEGYRELGMRAANAENTADALRSERDRLQRYFDEAGGEKNLVALLDLYHERMMKARAELDEERKVMAKMMAALEEERLRVKTLQVRIKELEAKEDNQ